MKSSFRLTWSREPAERGLARICQGERGRILKVNGVVVGHVSALGGRFNKAGYYWYAGHEALGVPSRNTADDPCPTQEEAVRQCALYVRSFLVRKAQS